MKRSACLRALYRRIDRPARSDYRARDSRSCTSVCIFHGWYNIHSDIGVRSRSAVAHTCIYSIMIDKSPRASAKRDPPSPPYKPCLTQTCACYSRQTPTCMENGHTKHKMISLSKILCFHSAKYAMSAFRPKHVETCFPRPYS